MVIINFRIFDSLLEVENLYHLPYVKLWHLTIWRWWQAHETAAVGRPMMSGWKKSSSSPRTQVEPQSHNFKGGIDFKFSEIHVAFCCSPSRKRVAELTFFLQNYKLFTQPAGKADLTETQARKVRDGDVRHFFPCISQFSHPPKHTFSLRTLNFVLPGRHYKLFL